MHYLSVCSGFWAPAPDLQFLTDTKTNITCYSQGSGYVFSLARVVKNKLEPSVKGLVDELPVKETYDTKPWIGLWYTGIGLLFLEIVLLPFTFEGKRRINAYAVIIATVSPTILLSPPVSAQINLD